MNPGVTEEAGETARSLIDSLKSTPVVLSLVVFNVLYLSLGSWQQIKDGEHRTELLKTWAEEHRHNTELLARCVIPPPVGMKLQSDESHPVELEKPP